MALDIKTLICFYFGMVLELEGALRFARDRKASRPWYWGAGPFLLLQGWLTVGRDEVVLRSLVVAVYMAWVSFRIAWIFLAGKGWSNHLYRLVSALYVLMGAAILVRAVLWITTPSHGLFDAPYFPGEAVEVSVSVEGDRAKVEVSERGPGIRQEIQGSLFEPFVTSRTGHAGLGLALARHHVRSHGGDLEGGDSEPGPGAVFAATLPLRPEFCDATEVAEVKRDRSG